MRQLATLLGDSLREAVDKKALLVMLGLAVLAMGWCAGLSFEERPPADVLAGQVGNIGRFVRQLGGMSRRSSSFGTDVSLLETRALEPADGFSPDLAGGHLVRLRFGNDRDLDQLVRARQRFEIGESPFGGRSEQPDDDETIPDDRRVSFFEWRFVDNGWSRVEARRIADQERTWEVAVQSDDMDQVKGSFAVSRLFGVIRQEQPGRSKAESVVELQLGLGNQLVGVFGMLIALLTCAGFVPSMLQKGALDLNLARPIGRGRLLFYKYLGGLWFILITTVVTIFGCQLVIAARTGVFNPWFLGTIPVLVLSFAVVYAFVVLMGVLTRSGTIAGLLGVGVWWIAEITHQMRHGLRLTGEWDDLPGWGRGVLETLYWGLPKTQDLGLLNRLMLSRSELSETTYRALFGGALPELDWGLSLGTTIAFSAAMLGLAVWRFRRRDW